MAHETKTTPSELMILIALRNRELYGLEIQRAIAECSDGREDMKIGSLYPLLHSLDQKRLVVSRWGDESADERTGARRRYYRITPTGRTTVDRAIEFQGRLLAWNPLERTTLETAIIKR